MKICYVAKIKFVALLNYLKGISNDVPLLQGRLENVDFAIRDWLDCIPGNVLVGLVEFK